MYQIHEEEFIKKIEEFKNSFEEEQQKDLQLNLQNIPDNQINIPEINQIYKSNIENIRLIKVKIEKFINSYNDSIPKNDFKIIDIEKKIKENIKNVIQHYREINNYKEKCKNNNISEDERNKLESLLKKYEKIYKKTIENLIDEIKILISLLKEFVIYVNNVPEKIKTQKKEFEDIFKDKKILKIDELNHKMLSSYSKFLTFFEKIRCYLDQINIFISKHNKFKKLKLIQEKINGEIISKKLNIPKFNFNTLLDDINLFEKLKQNKIIENSNIPDVCIEQIKFNILFIFDITSSMGKYIEEFKNKYYKIIEDLEKNCPLSLIYLGFIGYKDIGDLELGDEYIDIDFTLLYEKIFERIENIQAEGGDDIPEDVSGAFEMALKKSWNSGTNIIFLITDSPCHGTKYHDLDQKVEALKDRFKAELYTDVIEEFRREKIENLVEKFVERNFNLICLNIHENTKKMFNMFQEKYISKNKSNLFCLSEKNLDKCIIQNVSDIYLQKEEEILNCLKLEKYN